MIGSELGSIFKRAIQMAKDKRHDYLTIEHIFFAVLLNEKGIKILKKCGCDIHKLRESVENHIENSVSSSQRQSSSYEPYYTPALSRTLDIMMVHTQNTHKKEASIIDLLLAICEDEKSYAYFILQKENISKKHLLNIIEKNKQELEEQEPKELSKYAKNLTKEAKKGSIDPLIGRENELELMMQTLCRRKKNNPILIGEPGVGKTSLVEGLALKIIKNEVPNKLKNINIYSLDLGSLLAGSKYRGDFEKRIKTILEELEKMDDAILFIDEIHTLIAAGAVNGGSMDAANQLKPILEKSKLKCIGATTYTEYRNIFDKDRALSRRFNKIDIKEPNSEDTFKILNGLKSKYEKHHNVKYTQEALRKSIELSKKFIADRFLPDMAIDIIDEVGASFHVKNKKKKQINQEDIEEFISKLKGIPKTKVSNDDKKTLKNLEADLKKKVLGQDKAIEKIALCIKRSRAGINTPNKPIGSFLFTGPTGVGKTELAKSLAKVLNVNFQRFDMSEYMEKHSISKLIGTPPGYVGYEQGGLLTETVKKNPYCLLLLDEIEKANPELINILLQVMDNASLIDNNGNKADFKNVILIMTSNLGTKESNIMGFESKAFKKLENALKDFFSLEFINRLDDVIQFESLNEKIIKLIVDKFINELNEQVKAKKIIIKLTEKAKLFIAKEGYNKEFGARPLTRTISKYIKDKLINLILFEDLKDQEIIVDFKNNNINIKVGSKIECI